ncbi:MAG: DUF2282 domain-containing protein [Leptospirales bacterium]|nr:DUF2282 domain-containing protein [Leptospirales bacterium]
MAGSSNWTKRVAAAALVSSALGGSLAFCSPSNGGHPEASEWQGTERCAGVARAGKNDCSTSAHSCSGQASADNVAGEWISVPKGLCEKIAGGRVI